MGKEEYNELLLKTIGIERDLREGKHIYKIILSVLRLIISIASHIYNVNKRISNLEDKYIK